MAKWICQCGKKYATWIDMDACAYSHDGEAVKINHLRPGSTQIGGDHYEAMPIQPWDATEAWWGRQALIYALLKDVVKYIARHERKNGLEDLKKAQDCLRKVVELKEKSHE